MSFGSAIENQSPFLRTVFDAMPVPAFIVDDDVRIEDFNTAAGGLLGPRPEKSLHQRSGEAMHCINSEAHGCGRSEPCTHCVIRNSVKAALHGGLTHRQMHRAELRTERNTTTTIDLLVTASPLLLPDFGEKKALLMLEDVTELLTLRGLLPICAQCKKVRDDDQYWQDIDKYLHTQMHMKVTHGLCPSCFTEQLARIESLNSIPAGTLQQKTTPRQTSSSGTESSSAHNQLPVV